MVQKSSLVLTEEKNVNTFNFCVTDMMGLMCLYSPLQQRNKRVKNVWEIIIEALRVEGHILFRLRIIRTSRKNEI